MKIQKSNGIKEEYNPSKVRASLERAGTQKEVIDSIITALEAKVKNGMTTKELYAIVRELLKEHQPAAAARYNLRDGIMRLGPAGYHFEKYVASVLAAYGYETELPDTYQGACVTHEVDVIAKKDGRSIFIEAKFRHDFNDKINIKDTMSTWTRFLDLVDGSKLHLCPHFDEAWIVTNARFTDQSLQFGHCKNMKLVGWKHPEERSFEQMIDINALYPITILELSNEEISEFAKAGIMLCGEVFKLGKEVLSSKLSASDSRLDEIIEICKEVCASPHLT